MSHMHRLNRNIRMSLVSAKGLSVGYGRNLVLGEVSLAVAAGEVVTLIGPNGSGKTTLLRALLGIVSPVRGTITRQPGLRIGYVPQKIYVDAALPLSVNRFMSLPKWQTRQAVTQVLERVGAIRLRSRQVRELSGGQMQRVLLARALLAEPQIFFLDEPAQGLDQPSISDFHRLIGRLRHETGCAVLLVSHDLKAVMNISDRVICLNGYYVCEGPPSVVSESPEYKALFEPSNGNGLSTDHSKPDRIGRSAS